MNSKTVIIGAGPIGMTMAAKLAIKNEQFLVLEQGNRVGSNVLEWGHVHLFTPLHAVVDTDVDALLTKHFLKYKLKNIVQRSTTFITGQELVDDYLQPLSELPLLQDSITLGARVIDIQYTDHQFTITYEKEGTPHQVHSQAVIDASGNWGHYNQVVTAATDQIEHSIADVEIEKQLPAYSSVAVIGNGHSAMNSLKSLVKLQAAQPSLAIHWLVRNNAKFNNVAHSNSKKLEDTVQGYVTEKLVQLHEHFAIQQSQPQGNSYVLTAANGTTLEVDKIFANTGCHPDYSLLTNIDIQLDAEFQCPTALKTKIDPEVNSSCQISYDLEDLHVTDIPYYVIGMKSFGKMPNFFLKNCYHITERLSEKIVAMSS